MGAELPVPLQFYKYQALGNDYLVVEPPDLAQPVTPDLVRKACDRHYGIGADGILFGPLPSQSADFGLRIFNPDGSEAEKSGNGLRIFAHHLWQSQQVGEAWFSVETVGGTVRCQVQPGGRVVWVEMGRASFDSQAIPLRGARRQVINEILPVGALSLRICALTLGNPHCVVLDQPVTPETAQRLGPLVEMAHLFPQRTNVQFLQVINAQNLRIEIWERGAGYTLASGSSACAAASAAYQLGWCAAQVNVHMPGGVVQVSIGTDGLITLIGPVTRVCDGRLWLQDFAG